MIELLGYFWIIATLMFCAAVVGWTVGYQWHALDFEMHAGEAMRLANGETP